MDFRHLIVTCLFSMLRLSFETQKIKENYAIFSFKTTEMTQEEKALFLGKNAERFYGFKNLISLPYIKNMSE